MCISGVEAWYTKNNSKTSLFKLKDKRKMDEMTVLLVHFVYFLV
jgi:hypothetical protein